MPPPARSPNFEFLASHDPSLAALGALAERAFADDPNTTLLKLRQLAEQLGQRAAAETGIYVGPQEAQVDLLRRLEQRGTIQRAVAELFHGVRKAGNKAMHEGYGDRMEALHQLKMARQIAIWFHRTFGRAPSFNPGPFVPPPDPEETNRAVAAEMARLREELSKSKLAEEQAKAVAEEAARARLSADDRAKKEAEEKAIWQALADEAEKKLATELAKIQHAAEVAPANEIQKFVAASNKASEQLEIDEAATRRLIDEQLRSVGWEVDTEALSYQAGARPQKGRNLAIAEWPASDPDAKSGEGRADYVLFRGLHAVAVIEAKRQSKNVAGVLQQAKRYARGLTLEAENLHPKAPWTHYRVPFLFATNGRPYLKQLEEQSGVWFLDGRKSTNHPRALEHWYTPEGLEALLRQDVDQAYEQLRNEPVEILALRPFQRDAIRAIEEGLAAGKRAMLLAMATGTGKTRTAIGLCYRLLKSKAVRRILFLVDRESLGAQAQDAFKDARIETSKTFADIYELKELRDIRPEPDTKVHFATVQGLVKRVLYPSEGITPPPVDQYDCIVIDECHRGYALDREMSDAELGFRDQNDYVSQYRRVLEHFDAVKIGLTATPALHTTEIFGRPVYEYSYRQAVIDNVLVDHEPPVQIVTRLAEDGMTWRAGEQMEIFDPKAAAIDKVTLPDDVSIEIESYNKKVVTENFNRAVCRRLADDLDPTLEGKTIVFCATDAHADLVVKILKEAFTEKNGEIDDDAVMKITGASDQPLQLIRRFKNERLPNVAVTVDLLTTGVDVPKICNVVFLRRVRSRILYEQMLGRATRRCDEIGKEVFRIFDAVDLYSAMECFSDMKPVVANPKVTFEQLVRELTTVTEQAHRQVVLEELIAKLGRKSKRLKGDALESFEAFAGMTPEALLVKLRSEPASAAAEWFAKKKPLADLLDVATKGNFPLVISHHADEVREVRRGYGKDGEAARPEDYLESFGKFLRENANKIPALVVVTQRPRDLTRKELKELKAALDGQGFSESYLRTAWKDKTNADIAATIIGFVRQAALGDALVPYEERVDRAMKKVLASRAWNEKQREWLKRIGKQLKIETIVDREALDQGQFKSDGGYARIDKVFEGKLDEVLGELRERIWEDAG